MHAIQVNEFGTPDVLTVTELSDPTPGPGEVVIAVEAVDVINLHTTIRSGAGVDYFPVRPPYVPGGAVVGRVTAIGSDVDPSWRGRRVAVLRGVTDACAERIIARAEALVDVPDSLSAQAAASVLHDGPTALGLVEWTAPEAGETALVTAGAGGMGLVLIQLLTGRGVRVVATARGSAKLDAIARVGATGIDHSTPDWAQRARELAGPHGFSVVYDGAGGDIGEAAAALAASNARISLHGMGSGRFGEHVEAQARDIRGIETVQFDDSTHQRYAARALRLLAEGGLDPVVGGVWPLSELACAHRAIEARDVVGRAVVTVSTDHHDG